MQEHLSEHRRGCRARDAEPAAVGRAEDEEGVQDDVGQRGVGGRAERCSRVALLKQLLK